MGSFIPQKPLHEFQIDLIYLLNKNKRYGLVCVDAFTKVMEVELMARKTKEETVKAMRVILGKMGIPELVYCDEGSEFIAGLFKELMEEKNIEIIYTLTHATMVERVNRTIKEMLYKYLQSTNSKTITNALPLIVNNYNNSVHNTTKKTPREAQKAENKDEVFKNIVGRATVFYP